MSLITETYLEGLDAYSSFCGSGHGKARHDTEDPRRALQLCPHLASSPRRSHAARRGLGGGRAPPAGRVTGGGRRAWGGSRVAGGPLARGGDGRSGARDCRQPRGVSVRRRPGFNEAHQHPRQRPVGHACATKPTMHIWNLSLASHAPAPRV